MPIEDKKYLFWLAVSVQVEAFILAAISSTSLNDIFNVPAALLNPRIEIGLMSVVCAILIGLSIAALATVFLSSSTVSTETW